MSEEFFGGLRERAGHKIEEDFATPTDYRHRIGINATIKALKEMMVGKPRTEKVYVNVDDNPYSFDIVTISFRAPMAKR